MSLPVTRMLVEAHTTDLAAQAQQTRLVREARAGHRRPSRSRAAAARLLVAVAARLDHRLQAPARRPAPHPART
jgi:hypothetical protein